VTALAANSDNKSLGIGNIDTMKMPETIGVIPCGPELTAAQLARHTYGSFATAWQVRRDWAMLNE
jgi:hypothetical protein